MLKIFKKTISSCLTLLFLLLNCSLAEESDSPSPRKPVKERIDKVASEIKDENLKALLMMAVYPEKHNCVLHGSYYVFTYAEKKIFVNMGSYKIEDNTKTKGIVLTAEEEDNSKKDEFPLGGIYMALHADFKKEMKRDVLLLLYDNLKEKVGNSAKTAIFRMVYKDRELELARGLSSFEDDEVAEVLIDILEDLNKDWEHEFSNTRKDNLLEMLKLVKNSKIKLALLKYNVFKSVWDPEEIKDKIEGESDRDLDGDGVNEKIVCLYDMESFDSFVCVFKKEKNDYVMKWKGIIEFYRGIDCYAKGKAIIEFHDYNDDGKEEMLVRLEKSEFGNAGGGGIMIYSYFSSGIDKILLLDFKQKEIKAFWKTDKPFYEEEIFQLGYYDYDKDGSCDIVLTKYNNRLGGDKFNVRFEDLFSPNPVSLVSPMPMKKVFLWKNGRYVLNYFTKGLLSFISKEKNAPVEEFCFKILRDSSKSKQEKIDAVEDLSKAFIPNLSGKLWEYYKTALDAEVGFKIINVIASLNDKEIASSLLVCLQDKKAAEIQRSGAMKVLTKMKYPQLSTVLMNILAEEEQDWAAVGLGNLREEKAVKLIEKKLLNVSLTESGGFSKMLLVYALEKIDNLESCEVLFKATSDKESKVREQALSVLERQLGIVRDGFFPYPTFEERREFARSKLSKLKPK